MWDEKYARDGYLYGTDPNGFLRENFRSIPEGKVLCLADGEGRNSVFLAEQGYDVTAVDQDFAALDIRHLADVDREIVEGSGHTGTVSVVRLIAVK